MDLRGRQLAGTTKLDLAGVLALGLLSGLFLGWCFMESAEMVSEVASLRLDCSYT